MIRIGAPVVGAGELHAVAPAALRRAEGGVGRADEVVDAVGPLGGARDPDADGHDAAGGVRERERLDDAAQALGGERGRLERLLGQQDEELLAAVAVDRVAAADGVGERRAHAAQQGVALEVAGAVVVALEAVDVEERDAPAVAVALRAGAHRLEVLGEAVAVAQTGERVLARLTVQPAVERGHARGADEHPLELLAL